jgi:hypothetical protein
MSSSALTLRYADAVQFFHLALGSLEVCPGSAFALRELDVVKRRGDCLANHRRSRPARQRREASGSVFTFGAVS